MKNQIPFIAILILLLYILFLQECRQPSGNTTTHQVDTIIHLDTVFAPPVLVQMEVPKPPPPTIIYLDTNGRELPPLVASQNGLELPLDSSKLETVHLYQDSTEDENLTLFYKAKVKGLLLDNALSYRLKVPKMITKTIEVPKPYPSPTNALFLVGGVGGNLQQFSSLTAGLNYTSAAGWSLGYDYDFLQQVHCVKVGVRLFQLKTKTK